MSKPMPSSGPEREIFLRALREYSEQCQPPTLTVGCPFAYDLQNGIRGCLEECIELLSEYQAPPPMDEIRVGNSLALLPRLPRARRGPVVKAKPFDAGEIYYTDSQLEDIAQWRMTALLEATSRLLCWEDIVDTADRAAKIERVRNEIGRRGFVFEKFARYCLAPRISVAIYATAVFSRIISGFSGEQTPLVRRVQSWIPALGCEVLEPVEPGDDLPESMTTVLEPSKLAQVTNWIRTAPIEDIIDLIPPGKDLIEYSVVDEDISHSEKSLYQWLSDRFTSTYLWRWSPSSLKLEWKYQHGLLETPCRKQEMSTPYISESDLAKQIAARSVEEEDEGRIPGMDATQFVPIALQLLSAGRRKEAAAIFEAAVSLSPRDPFAANNWGFCLMPESPDRALALLDEAAENGLADNLMIIGNRLWCLLRLNRQSTALSVADGVISSLATHPSFTAYMWSPKGDAVEFQNDIRVYILDLISMVVENSADSVISERWKPIIDSVRADILRR